MLRFLLEDKTKRPTDFLTGLIQMLNDEPVVMETVFAPVLLGLSERVKNCSIADTSYKYPLQAMSELCEMRLGTSSSVRPICNLVCKKQI